MNLPELPELLARFSRSLPHFADGRIDYTGAPEVAGTNVVVVSRGQILLLKRSEKVGSYRGYWHVVAGYLDEEIPLKDKVLIELNEELKVGEGMVAAFQALDPLLTEGQGGVRVYLYPALVRLEGRPEITLDWEHTEYRWVSLNQLEGYELVPGVSQIVAGLEGRLEI